MSETKALSVHERLYLQKTAASAPRLDRPGGAASANRPVSMSTRSREEAPGKIIYLLSYDERYPEKEKVILTENMKKDGSRPRHDLKHKAELLGVSRGHKVLISPAGKFVCNTAKMESLDLDNVRTGNCYLVLNSAHYGIVKGTDELKDKVEHLRQVQNEGKASPPFSSSPSASYTSRSSLSSRSSPPNSRSPLPPSESTDIGIRLSHQGTAASEGRFDFPANGSRPRAPGKPVVTALSREESQAKTIYLLDYDEKTPTRQTLVLRENAKKDGSRIRHDIKKCAEAMGSSAGGPKLLINIRGETMAHTARLENLELSKLNTNDCFFVVQTALYAVVRSSPEYSEKLAALVRSHDELLDIYRLKHERRDSVKSSEDTAGRADDDDGKAEA